METDFFYWQTNFHLSNVAVTAVSSYSSPVESDGKRMRLQRCVPAARCWTQRPAASSQSIQNVCLGIRSGVSDQSSVPHTAHMLSGVCTDTPDPAPAPLMYSLLTSFVDNKRSDPESIQPAMSYITSGVRGHNGSQRAAPGGGQRSVCLTAALFLMTSLQLIGSNEKRR